ncbi:hypothetical protein AK51_06220 [Serratia nematodiphila DZ0503SBS1]|nr:hypothetical protein AK51_06220 [Serratia nematodiphila DZ0503SBS1]
MPDLPLAEIKGLRVTRCGSRHPADKVFCQQDRADKISTGSGRLVINLMPGRIPTLRRWNKAMWR